MHGPNSILASYASAFRDLVNDRIWGKGESAAKALRLKDDRDWDYICVAMDVVEDALLAIGSFLHFSLDGPTRYEDIGERYLRLYGLLSAAYVQQQAVLKLYSLMNCSNPKAIRDEFDKLEIRTLRHQLASHSLDFLRRGESRTQAFVPVRVGLSGFSCTVTEDRGGATRTIKLDEAVKAHCVAVTSVLDRIYEKPVKTIFKGQATKIAKYEKKLEDLRFVRDGNLIIGFGEQGHEGGVGEIRMLFTGSRKTSHSIKARQKGHGS
mgnify:CR=1 FL=1